MTTVKLAFQPDWASWSRCFNLNSADMNNGNDVEHRRRGSLSQNGISFFLLNLEAILAKWVCQLSLSPHTHTITETLSWANTHTYVHFQKWNMFFLSGHKCTLIKHTWYSIRQYPCNMHTHKHQLLSDISLEFLLPTTYDLYSLCLILVSVSLLDVFLFHQLFGSFSWDRERIEEDQKSKWIHSEV